MIIYLAILAAATFLQARYKIFKIKGRNTYNIYPGNIVQIIGFPRGGKSLFAAKIANDNWQRFRGGVFDTANMMYSKAKSHITSKDLSRYRFTWSLFIFDEAQLNGFHNRSWATNLRDYDNGQTKNVLLNQLTEIGHYHNAAVIITHGKDEIDSCVRDQNLIRATFYCRRAYFPFSKWFCVAIRQIEHTYFDDNMNICHQIENPGILKRLFVPGVMFWVNIKKYGAMYDSWAKDPDIEVLPAFGDQSAEDPPPQPEKKKRGRPKKTVDK